MLQELINELEKYKQFEADLITANKLNNALIKEILQRDIVIERQAQVINRLVFKPI